MADDPSQHDQDQDQDLPTRFAACVQRVRAATAPAPKLSDAQRLELYGLYKQATEGDNATKSPGLLDFVGRCKWNVWKALAGLDAASAMQQYVDRVAAWFPPADSTPLPPQDAGAAGGAAAAAAGGGGGGGGGEGGMGELSFGTASVSTMGAIGLDGRVVEEGAAGAEEDGPRGVFLFAKRGAIDEVVKLLEGGGVSVDAQDEEGRSPLHWAVDGGHAALVACLLERGADVGLKDSQGDTALDYAELCEYEGIAARLRQVMQERG